MAGMMKSILLYSSSLALQELVNQSAVFHFKFELAPLLAMRLYVFVYTFPMFDILYGVLRLTGSFPPLMSLFFSHFSHLCFILTKQSDYTSSLSVLMSKTLVLLEIYISLIYIYIYIYR